MRQPQLKQRCSLILVQMKLSKAQTSLPGVLAQMMETLKLQLLMMIHALRRPLTPTMKLVTRLCKVPSTMHALRQARPQDKGLAL